MNETQIEYMQHALNNGNRFYTEKDDEFWNDLVDKGYASKHPGWEEDTAYFRVTAAGKEALRIETDPKYFDYNQAIEYMSKGHTTSNLMGKYDYYVMKDGVVYGEASCDPELYGLENEELDILKQHKWYLIS